MIKDQNLTDISNENISDINKQIEKTIKDLTRSGINSKDIPNLVTGHLESIKTLLMQPEYSKSYPNIRSLFENKDGFDALKEVLQFQCNEALGRRTQDDINPSDSMEVLKRLFVKSNNQASEIQQNIAEIEKSIESKKEQSKEFGKNLSNLSQSRRTIDPFYKELNDILKTYGNSIKEQSLKKSGILELILLLFDRIIKKFKTKEYGDKHMEQKSKSQFYVELPISSTASAHDEQEIDESGYATIEELGIATPKVANDQKQQKTDSSSKEQIYVSAEEVRRLKAEQKAKALPEKQVIQYQVVHNPPQHIQVSELPKPQKAQISSRQKPTIAPKPSQEAINKALNKTGAGTQKKVAPPVPPKPRANKDSDLKWKFEPSSQQSRSMLEIANKFEKPQEVSRNVAKNINAQNIKTEVTSLRQNSIAEPAKNQARPQTLKISTRSNWASNVQPNHVEKGNVKELAQKMINRIPMGSPTTSPKQSTTFTKKTFGTVVENNQVQNEAPKEIKQSIASNANGTSIPPPPPMRDLANFKPKLASSHVDDNKVQNHEARKTKTPRSVSPERHDMIEELKQQFEKKVQTKLDTTSVERGSESTRSR